MRAEIRRDLAVTLNLFYGGERVSETHNTSSFSHLLCVEPDGGRRVDVVLELEAVEHRRLARRVQPDHGAVVRPRTQRQRDVLPQRLPADPAPHLNGRGDFKP